MILNPIRRDVKQRRRLFTARPVLDQNADSGQRRGQRNRARAFGGGGEIRSESADDRLGRDESKRPACGRHAVEDRGRGRRASRPKDCHPKRRTSRNAGSGFHEPTAEQGGPDQCGVVWNRQAQRGVTAVPDVIGKRHAAPDKGSRGRYVGARARIRVIDHEHGLGAGRCPEHSDREARVAGVGRLDGLDLGILGFRAGRLGAHDLGNPRGLGIEHGPIEERSRLGLHARVGQLIPEEGDKVGSLLGAESARLDETGGRIDVAASVIECDHLFQGGQASVVHVRSPQRDVAQAGRAECAHIKKTAADLAAAAILFGRTKADPLEAPVRQQGPQVAYVTVHFEEQFPPALFSRRLLDDGRNDGVQGRPVRVQGALIAGDRHGDAHRCYLGRAEGFGEELGIAAVADPDGKRGRNGRRKRQRLGLG